MGEQHHSYSATAARRLRTLHAERLGRTAQPAEGSASIVASSPKVTAVHGSLPIDLDVLDYITAAAHEVVAHTYTAVPTAGPAPTGIDSIYAWSEEVTADLPAERQQFHDALMVRQGFEHALRAGDETVIRRESCPACSCWGLFWSRAARVATCVNKRCTTKTGRASRWTLQQLAERHVARQATALPAAT